MIEGELVLDCSEQPQTIDKKQMLSKCKVRMQSPDDTNRESRENHDVYICRYKLIRKTKYVLLPIACKTDVRSNNDSSNDNHNIQAANEAAQQLTKMQIVSPIVNGKVETSKRSANGHIHANNDDSDDDESPSKRVKRNKEKNCPTISHSNLNDIFPANENGNDQSSNGCNNEDAYSRESSESRTKRSASDKNLKQRGASIRKNLNESFLANEQTADDEANMSIYEITNHDSLKMKIKR